MTLLPLEQQRIAIAENDWVFEGFPSTCQAPECRRPAMQGTHHCVRRSHTGGPCRWIAIDGIVVLNEVVLCYECHHAVTVHTAWVIYNEQGWWDWYVEARLVPGAEGQRVIQQKSQRVFVRIGSLKGVRWNPATEQVETVR